MMSRVGRREILATSLGLAACGQERWTAKVGAPVYGLLALGEYQAITLVHDGRTIRERYPENPREALLSAWLVQDVSPAGTTILVERFAGARQLELWDWRGTLLSEAKGWLAPSAVCHRLAPNLRWVASLERADTMVRVKNGRIRLFDLEKRQTIDHGWRESPRGTPERLEWSPSSEELLFSEEGRVMILEVASGKRRTVVEGTCASWHPSGKEILLMNRQGQIEWRDLASGKQRVVLEKPGALDGAEFAPDGESFAVAKRGISWIPRPGYPSVIWRCQWEGPATARVGNLLAGGMSETRWIRLDGDARDVVSRLVRAFWRK